MDLSFTRLAIDIAAWPSGQALQEPANRYLELIIGAILIGLGLLALALVIIARRDEALRSSQARLSAIIDTAIDGIITIDQTGIIRSCNPAIERIFGYTAPELLSQTIDILMPLPYHNQHTGYLGDYLRTGKANIIGKEREVTGRRKDGSLFPLTLAVTEVRINRQRFFTGIVRDITEQKRVEEVEHERRVLAEVLRHTAAALNSTLDLESVVDNILSLLSGVVPHDSADIMLLDDEGSGVTVVSRSNQVGHYKRSSGPIFPVTMTSDLEHMLKNGQSLLIPDLERDPRWAGLRKARQARSYLGAAIGLGGRTIGFINLDSNTPDFFTASHASRLEIFANQAAAALENARLYKELEAFSTSLARLVEDRTAQLEHAKERVESILNSNPDALLILDREGKIQNGNSAFTRAFGYHIDEVYGRGLPLLLTGIRSQTLNRIFRAALTAGQQGRLEAAARHKDGTTFDAELAISPIVGDDGIQGLVCSLRDIRALKQVERMKDAFVSNVSHELRTPVTSLKLFLRLMQRVPPEEHADIVTTLIRETDRLQNIIEDVLNLSRLDQGSMQLRRDDVDINALIEQYIADRAMIARTRGIWLKVDLAASLPTVWADAGLAGQALNVLISNAFNYTPANGEVVVSTRLERQDRRKWVVCTISDTGPGIALDEQMFLFQRFFRGKAGRESTSPGTGLGLSIAREIMDRHGGRVTVHSEGIAGQGAAFSLWFPVRRARRARTPATKHGQ